MMITDPFGIYIHIPFCLKKCNYCDFCSYSDWKEEERKAYLTLLSEEIRAFQMNGKIVSSVFFGGGTPSLLTESELEMLFETLRNTTSFSENPEITIEANPKTLTPQKVKVFRQLGINRISIGLQSINENEQKILGRIHLSEDFYRSVEMIQNAGFDNYNVDVMYGIPEQTIASFEKTLDAVLSVKPSHVSAYSLILEEGTPLCSHKNEYVFPSEEEELAMVDLLQDKLSSAGLFRYEISNFAKPGKKCKHNLNYWYSGEYAGFGVAAHSYVDGVRYYNTPDRRQYLSSSKIEHIKEAVLSLKEKELEYIMLRLRLCEGFSLADFRKRFGYDFMLEKDHVLRPLIQNGFALQKDDRFFLTGRGLYVSNTIINEIT